MTRFLRRLAIAVLALGLANAASAQSAEDVIQKSLDALGGRAAFARIKNRVSSGTITLVTPMGELPGTVETWNAAPNKTRSVIKADLTQFGAGPLVVDQRFNGTAGYVMDSLQGNRDITGNQLDNMKNGSFPNAYLTYKAMGIAVKLAGKEKDGGHDMFVLVFEPPSGSAVKQYVDAETFLPVKSVMTINVPQLGTDVEMTTDFSDFKDVDGVKVPTRIRLSSSVQNYTIVLTKIEQNVTIDEALFSKP